MAGANFQNMGRPHTLDREGAVEKFAELWALGMLQKDLAEEFGVHPRKIKDWVKRDDVKLHARKVQQERALAIRRKVDGKVFAAIEALDPADRADVETLLKIRKEFKFDDTGDADKTEQETLMEAMQMLDEHPEVAEKLQAAADVDAGE